MVVVFRDDVLTSICHFMLMFCSHRFVMCIISFTLSVSIYLSFDLIIYLSIYLFIYSSIINVTKFFNQRLINASIIKITSYFPEVFISTFTSKNVKISCIHPYNKQKLVLTQIPTMMVDRV